MQEIDSRDIEWLALALAVGRLNPDVDGTTGAENRCVCQARWAGPAGKARAAQSCADFTSTAPLHTLSVYQGIKSRSYQI